MAELTENQPLINTEASPAAPAAAPTPPPPPGGTPVRQNNLRLWLGVVLVVILGVSFLLILGKRPTPREEAQGQPTPTLASTSTPAPYREPSALASQSAFLNLAQSLASFSANLQAFPATDPQLVPPVLDLTLGFSN